MNKKITTAFAMILFINLISASVIEIENPSLDISMHSGETIYENITIKTLGDYTVYLSYSITNNQQNLEGLSVNFESPIQVNKERDVLIEISTSPYFKPDNFTLNLYANTTREGNVTSQVYGGIFKKIDTDFGLELEMNSTGNGTIIIEKYSSNPKTNSSFLELGKFFEINVEQSILDNMNLTTIKVSYSDSEVSDKGIAESTLRIYHYNEENNAWEVFDSPSGGVDRFDNFVWAKTTHFSTFGVFGSAPSPKTEETKSESGGSSDSFREPLIFETINLKGEPEGFYSIITGAVIGIVNKPAILISITFMTLILLLGIIVIIKRFG